MSISQPRWEKVEYSRSQIKKAGKLIRNSSSEEDEAHARAIIDNWRASHAYPLHVIYTHLKNMAPLDGSVIVAQRLKRLESIVSKLKRETSMSLWNIQDLGGCRYIVPNITEVYASYNKLKNSRMRHRLVKEYDYITSPKMSGYRSLHLVYEFCSDQNEDYNSNMLIEIQIRTHIQHLWATAVETMGLFKNLSIKAGQGDEELKRFFCLVSTLFAIEEEKPIVPNTPDDISSIVNELRKLDEKNNYLDFLNGIRVATKFEEDISKKNGNEYCVLSLDYSTNRLTIKRFKASEIDAANLYYGELEKKNLSLDSVLVRVSSFSDLKDAYPNYFSDISEFVSKVERYIK